MIAAAPIPICKPPDVAWWAQWVRDTVLAFGAEASTAYFCAAHFAQGLECAALAAGRTATERQA